ncbi:hypothetical protein C8R47DRAFT_523139 [Mycena vitilis]|nr:hypothetical protein C8R47DRAFT_523139 [Mycena vitilis]
MTDSLLTDPVIARRSALGEDGLTLFDRYTAAFEKMGTANLGANEFGETFERIVGDRGGYVYVKKPGGAEFTANIIAEVGSASQGTWMAAYPKKNPPNLPFGDDHSPHRMTIAARCPTGATPEMECMFKEFLLTLDEARNKDEAVEEEKGEVFKLTEWTTREDNAKDKPADIIPLRLKPTYSPYGHRALSPARRVRNSRATAGEDVEMTGTSAAVLARKVGDTYPPDMLPDHKGDYFAHNKAKLVQRAYRDEDGNLIAPHELYSALTEGTLFSAQVSLSLYVIPEKNPKFRDSKIYHVNVDKLTILDKGYGEPWAPSVPTLPEAKSEPSTPRSKRVRDRDSAVDDAFDALSPSKKRRAT